MKIVIPTNGKKGLEEDVADHFGRCPTYTFLNKEGRVMEIIDNTTGHMGGFGLPPELIKRYGADILLCRELGPRALDLSKDLGIEVYVCRAKTVREIFSLWKGKKIKKAGIKDICQEDKT